MRRRPAAALVAPALLVGLVAIGPGDRSGSTFPAAPAPATAAVPTASPTVAATAALASLPLAFEPNVGQAPAGVDFVGRGPGYRVDLSPAEAAVSPSGPGDALRMRLVGADPAAVPSGAEPLPGRSNFLAGNDPARWRTGVPTYARVAYPGVWPGVDVVFLGDQHRLRHDFVVAPGADPGAIAVEFPDAPVTIDAASGDLLVGAARLSRPRLYQDDEATGRRLPVGGAFRLLGGSRVGFTVGDYDRSLPLVIDPTLQAATYFGGSGLDAATAVDVDGGGNIYVVGSTESSDLPRTNPVQDALNQDGTTAGTDAFVAKLNPEGTAVLFATFLGGTNRDAANGVAVGADGSVFVAGVTESGNFPRTTPAAQEAYGGGPSDAFITKLDPSGTTIAWSTFLGGSQTDAARAVAVSPAGEAYVTGFTNSLEFPTVNGLQASPPREDDIDAFVAKIAASGATLAYSTRLGGSNDDHGIDIATDATGNVYVTGDTRSPGFPTARPLQAGAGGTATGVAGSFADAFVSKLGPAGNNLVYSTFLGGSDSDNGTGIAVDEDGAAYVTGSTNSPDFPTADALQERKDGDTDAFLSVVNPAGSALEFSTYLGGGGADGGTAVAVDRLGAITVVGSTGSTNFPTADPLQGVKGGGATDGFVTTLAPDGSALVASTYLGGREDDQALGLALAGSSPVVVGTTSASDFPTANPLQAARSGTAADAFVARLSPAEVRVPATTAATATEEEAAPAGSGTSTHDRRVRLLVATTAGLFLIAVLQTAYLRRKSATRTEHWAPEAPEPAVPPVPVQQWGGGVRVIEEQPDDHEIDDDSFFASVVTDADRDQGKPLVTGGSEVAVPDLLDEDWATEADLEQNRASSRLPLEELSFWDLFPEDLPPSHRPPALTDDDWALEDQEQEDVLVAPEPPPPPTGWQPPPPPEVRDAPQTAEAGHPGPQPEPPDESVLLTELLAGDLSPAATRDANAAHYERLMGIEEERQLAHPADGGGSTGAGGHDAGRGANGDHAASSAPPAARRSGSGGKRPRKRGSGKRKRPPPSG